MVEIYFEKNGRRQYSVYARDDEQKMALAEVSTEMRAQTIVTAIKAVLAMATNDVTSMLEAMQK